VVRVAWVSKHPILPIQYQELKRKLGNDVEVLRYPNTFVSVEEVYTTLKSANVQYAVVVLPLSMIARLVEYTDVIFLWSEMVKVHDNCEGLSCPLFDPTQDAILPTRSNHGIFYRHFRFAGFKRIKAVRLELEDF